MTYNDNTTKAMPADYPMLVTSGDKHLFEFRFETFTTSAMYDPIISVEMDMDDMVTDGPVTTLTPAVETMSESNVEVHVMERSGKITVKCKSCLTCVILG